MNHWHNPPIPSWYEGRVLLVLLDEYAVNAAGHEYYGEVVAVTVWDEKLKTTIDPIRLEHDWVRQWMVPP